jgi:DNA-binding MarR family transcriptional regulator
MTNQNTPRILTNYDIFLLVAISNGVCYCSHLADSSGRNRTYVTERVKILEKCDLVQIEEVSQKSFSRAYRLTPTSQKIVSQLFYDANANLFLAIKQNLDYSQVVE